MTAENSQLDEIPPRLFLKLPLSAETVNRNRIMLMATGAQLHDQPIILCDPLMVHMDDVVDLLGRRAADALIRQRIPVSFDCRGCHRSILERHVVVEVGIGGLLLAAFLWWIVFALLVLD